MITERFSFPGARAIPMDAILWLPEGGIRGIIQVTHGMTEHIGRWEPLAEAMTARGIALCGFSVWGHDSRRTHHCTAAFGKDGWKATMEDMHSLFLLLRSRFPEQPHIMLGFSLGSFMLHEYLNRYAPELAGAVLMGTGYQPGFLLGLLQAVVKTQIRKVGWDKTTPLVGKLAFDNYNRNFAPNRTNSDWLCSDEKQLDGFINDPLCPEFVSAGLFWNLLGGMRYCGAPGSCSSWDKKLPVLLLSGAEDPVGGLSKGVIAMEKHLRKQGVENIELQLVSNARHDVLHEECSGAAAKARDILCRWAEDRVRQ